MRRVLVLGSSGAGKSTFARELGARLKVETIHLDSHYWQPNWTYTPEEEWDKKIKDLLARDGWVMDGNYPASLPLRMEYADSAVFIDRGRVVCLWRCVLRYLRNRGSNRSELAEGCYEKIDWDFFKWIWNYPRDVKPQVLKTLTDQPGKKVIVLRNDREISAFLAQVQPS